jgi:hypothetical protein
VGGAFRHCGSASREAAGPVRRPPRLQLCVACAGSRLSGTRPTATRNGLVTPPVRPPCPCRDHGSRSASIRNAPSWRPPSKPTLIRRLFGSNHCSHSIAKAHLARASSARQGFRARRTNSEKERAGGWATARTRHPSALDKKGRAALLETPGTRRQCNVCARALRCRPSVGDRLVGVWARLSNRLAFPPSRKWAQRGAVVTLRLEKEQPRSIERTSASRNSTTGCFPGPPVAEPTKLRDALASPPA